MERLNLHLSGIVIILLIMISSCEEISDNIKNGQVNEDPADYVWDENQAIRVSLNYNSITVVPSIASVSGGTLTIKSAGTYILKGSLSDGQIIVNTDDEEIVRLVLAGVNINCSKSAPIFVKHAAKVIIVLEENTENHLADGTTYATSDSEPNAAIFSNSYLSIHGQGTLTVTGNYNDGISSDDGLLVKSGIITVNAADDGIRGKDYLIIRDGKITVNSGGDGLISDNTKGAGKGYLYVDQGNINITSTGDAISAFTTLTIIDGIYTLTTIGGNAKSAEGPPTPPGGGGTTGGYSGTISAKGLKGLESVLIKTGTFHINSADDGIHSDGNITIDHGTFDIESGDDAIHADKSVTINGGTINISGCYEGIESALIRVNKGNINLVATDDGFNATKGNATEFNDGSSIEINGGFITVNCTKGDGLDSNGNISIYSGTIVVHGPQSQPEVGFDVNGVFKIDGGLFVATGPNSGNMIEVPASSSAQYSVRVIFQSTLTSSDLFHIKNSKGDNILTFKPVRNIYYIVVSCPELVNGSSYSIYTGGTSTGTNIYGLYQEGVYTGGTLRKTFTVSSKITGVSI